MPVAISLSLLSCDNQVFKYCQMLPVEQNHSQMRSTGIPKIIEMQGSYETWLKWDSCWVRPRVPSLCYFPVQCCLNRTISSLHILFNFYIWYWQQLYHPSYVSPPENTLLRPVFLKWESPDCRGRYRARMESGMSIPSTSCLKEYLL